MSTVYQAFLYDIYTKESVMYTKYFTSIEHLHYFMNGFNFNRRYVYQVMCFQNFGYFHSRPNVQTPVVNQQSNIPNSNVYTTFPSNNSYVQTPYHQNVDNSRANEEGRAATPKNTFQQFSNTESNGNKRGRFQFKFDPPTSSNVDFSFNMPSADEGGAANEGVVNEHNDNSTNETVSSEVSDLGVVEGEFEVLARPFDNMTMKAYGRGYLVKCPDDHPDKGKKYYHNGWWQECNQGWFIKKELKDFFLENGAVLTA